jgi:hypothetical protein
MGVPTATLLAKAGMGLAAGSRLSQGLQPGYTNYTNRKSEVVPLV